MNTWAFLWKRAAVRRRRAQGAATASTCALLEEEQVARHDAANRAIRAERERDEARAERDGWRVVVECTESERDEARAAAQRAIEELAEARRWINAQAEVFDAECDKLLGRLEEERNDVEKLRRVIHEAIAKRPDDDSTTTLIRARRKGS